MGSHEGAPGSWDLALNGFPGAAVLSAKGFVPAGLAVNGLGEHCMSSWDLFRAGGGGNVSMQPTELRALALVCVAGGNGTNPFGPGVRTGDACTGDWAFDTASRLSDRSSNGSLFIGDSSLMAGTPLVFTWKRRALSDQKNNFKVIYLLLILPALAFSQLFLTWGKYTCLGNRKLCSLSLWWIK